MALAILRGSRPADERARHGLARRMRAAKYPHLALLLDQFEGFGELSRFLAGEGAERSLEACEVPLLCALGVWAIHYSDGDDPGRLLKLAEALRAQHQANLARRLLRVKLWPRPADDLFRDIRAELALCTSVASDLPPGPRLNQAWELLNSSPGAGGELSVQPSQDQIDAFLVEADHRRLQRAAFIFKRKWDFERRKPYLEKAALLYQTAVERAPTPLARLSSCVEAAFHLDLLAMKDREAGATERAEQLEVEAEKLRRPLLADPGLETDVQGDYVPLTNLAQLHFGQYGRARRLVERGAPETGQVREDLEGWKRALAHLGDAQKLVPHVPAWLRDNKAREIAERSKVFRVEHEILSKLVGDRTYVVHAVAVGKLGLALSGGGFRASFFHLGVLARLAELHLLRNVEVLSCVSGGSIVGTHYYLELRKLLQSKKDDEIGHQDYKDLVYRLIDAFRAGVKKNIRTRVVANPLANLRMLLTTYTRSDRLGDLFERHLYARVEDGHEKKRLLAEMRVEPADADGEFNPAVHNWLRENKVPMLILNTTCLNTGHNWQFTSTWMGEPPAAIDTQVDANERLRRMYLDSEAPAPYDKLRLGRTVAASASVPGLFDPASLNRLYQGRRVRLVDGGVFDNQGVASLLEQECKVVLVSDASGQMDSQEAPSASALGVPLRSNSVLMDRVRQIQFRDLAARRESGQLRALVFAHLKKDLEGDVVDWLGCDDPTTEAERASGEKTGYGILKGTQRKLADIRTDLDSFCDAEALALMFSGYQMMREEDLRAELKDLCEVREPSDATEGGPERPWQFLCVRDLMTDPAWRDERFERVLDVANQRMFKIWQLWMKGGIPRALLAGFAVAATVALLLIYLLPDINLPGHIPAMAESIDSQWGGALARAAAIALAALPLAVLVLLKYPRLLGWLGRKLQLLVLGTVGMLFAWVHLPLFDPLYKRYWRPPEETL